LRGKCNEEETQGLKCITEYGERDWVEEKNFPLVHRIILGLSSKPVDSELADNPMAVYLRDTQGRTALDWAIARKQLSDATVLLSHGADPNSMDIDGRTTTLHAVDSHYTPGLRLVLEAQGNPNPELPKGLFRSSPLTAASYGALPEMVKLLLEFEANPNTCNPEGLTALHRTFDVECAMLLLEYGADPNATSSDGRTPLTTSIVNNHHGVLRVLLQSCHEHTLDGRLKGMFCP
jgi:ankyrin repeat protein